MLTLLVMHLDQYIFQAKVRTFILEKGFEKLYWPSLRLEKNHKLSRHVPPLKQLNFFHCYLTSRQTTHSTPQTVLIYTQQSLVIHWRNLNLSFVHRLNNQLLP